MPIPRTKDKCYLYTLNPSPINKRSNKIDHHLKIVDLYIKVNKPKQFEVEPVLGEYIPDVLYHNGREEYCVEIQLTPISIKKMQSKINAFVSTYGREHQCRNIIICSNTLYKGLTIPSQFKLIRASLPEEIVFQ